MKCSDTDSQSRSGLEREDKDESFQERERADVAFNLLVSVVQGQGVGYGPCIQNCKVSVLFLTCWPAPILSSQHFLSVLDSDEILQKYHSTATLWLLQYSMGSTCPPLPPGFTLNHSIGIFSGTKKHLKIKIHWQVDDVLFLFDSDLICSHFIATCSSEKLAPPALLLFAIWSTKHLPGMYVSHRPEMNIHPICNLHNNDITDTC